jgi:hypothetical protein
VPKAPKAVNVTLCPEQMVLLEAVIPVGAGVVPEQFVERYPNVLVEIFPHCGEQQFPTLK